jgi:hypothetical protein
VNPEATVVRERVADPVSAGACLHDDDNVATVVEIADGDATPFARPMTDCFNDQRVLAIVRRPRDPSQESKGSDLIRDTNDPFRKAHLIAPSSLTFPATGARER